MGVSNPLTKHSVLSVSFVRGSTNWYPIQELKYVGSCEAKIAQLK